VIELAIPHHARPFQNSQIWLRCLSNWHIFEDRLSSDQNRSNLSAAERGRGPVGSATDAMLRRSYLDGATSWLHRAWVPSPARRPRSQRCSARSCLRSPCPCSAPLAAVCCHRARSAPRLHRRDSRRGSYRPTAAARCAPPIFGAGYHTRLRWPLRQGASNWAAFVSVTQTGLGHGRRSRSDASTGS